MIKAKILMEEKNLKQEGSFSGIPSTKILTSGLGEQIIIESSFRTTYTKTPANSLNVTNIQIRTFVSF